MNPYRTLDILRLKNKDGEFLELLIMCYAFRYVPSTEKSGIAFGVWIPSASVELLVCTLLIPLGRF